MTFKEQIIALRQGEPALTYKEIAGRVGCDHSHVIRVCMDNGLLRERASTYKAQIVALRQAEPHLLYREIAARIGCKETTVSDVCHRTQLKSGYRSDGQLGNAVRLGYAAIRAGLTLQQIEGMTNARHA